VEGDDLEGDDEESDEEDGDEGDEELRRKRKRPKFPGVSKKALAERKTSTPATGGDSGVPEKRKRGRPRKVVPLPATAATVASPLAPLPQTQPLNAVLGCLLVKRVKQHLGELFIDSVYGRKSEKDDEESTKQKEGEMRRTIDAARELSGQVEELGRVLEKVWKTSCAALDHITVDLNLDKEVDVSQTQDSVDTQINALLSALVLYRRVFSDPLQLAGCSSALLSPPPPPMLRSESKGTRMVHALRQVLGSRVFEEGDGIEGDIKLFCLDTVPSAIADRSSNPNKFSLHPASIQTPSPSSRKQDKNGTSDTLARRSSIRNSSPSQVLCWMSENLGWMVSVSSG
jgi:hypothetical protein